MDDQSRSLTLSGRINGNIRPAFAPSSYRGRAGLNAPLPAALHRLLFTLAQIFEPFVSVHRLAQSSLAHRTEQGRAIDIEFSYSLTGRALVTFEVDETLKADGEIADAITLQFGGGPVQHPHDRNRAVLAYLEPAPLLLPGDEALLLLHETEEGRYEVQLATGVNRIANAAVQSLEGSPLSDHFDDRPLAEVIELIKGALR